MSNDIAYIENASPDPRRRSFVGAFIRLGIGLALMVGLVWTMQWQELLNSVQGLDWTWIAATGLSFLLSLALKLVRWRWLLVRVAPGVGWRALARAYFVGQAVNIVGMGRLGDLARVLWLRQEGNVSGVGVATSVVAEKLVDLVFMGLLSAWWLTTLLSPPEGLDLSLALIMSGVSAIALAAFAWFGQSALNWIHRWLVSRTDAPSRWLARRVGALAEGLAGLVQRRQLQPVMLITAAIWGVMLTTNALLLRAFGLPPAAPLAVSVLVLGLLGTSPNLTPANIGPYHWAVTLSLTLFGVAQSQALAYAIVLHAIVSTLPVLIAVVLNGWHWPDLRAMARETMAK